MGASSLYSSRRTYASRMPSRDLFEGTSVRAYDTFVPQRREQRATEPDIRVVLGQGSQSSQALSPSVLLFAKVIAVLLVVCAAVCVVRIGLSSATVSTSLQSQELSSQINSARMQGNQLEVAQSSLTNPTRVKTEATALGMADPAVTASITLEEDVVATDNTGALSLSKSLQRVAQV